jgi:valyl-tRNA synthetase
VVPRSAGPAPTDLGLLAGSADPALLADVGAALSGVRKAKSEAKASMRAEVERAVVHGPAEALDRIALAADDLRGAGRIEVLALEPGAEAISVDVVLKPAAGS